MAYQPKSYKKFVATAATATLVASAIVPVASASGFSDVQADNEFATYINALAEAGIIGGYASDNTFRPNNKLTRGQVAIMLGRWLENNGTAVPADWATNPRFEDVSTSNEELAKYAALVKDAGVFTGVAGKLNASANITRENMAVVLDRVAKTVTGTSFVELAADIEDVQVADLNATQYKEQVQALADLEITTVSNFRPQETVSRAQFAKFLYTSLEVIEGVLAEEQVTAEELQAQIAAVDATLPAVADIKADNAVAAKAAVEAAKTEVAKIKATIAETELTEEEVAALEKAIVAVEAKYEAIVKAADQAIEDAKELNIVSVVANSATEVVVTFSKAVDKSTVSVADFAFKSLDNAQVTAADLEGKLSEDGKTYTLTVKASAPAVKFAGRYDVTVAKDAIKTAKNQGVVKFESTIKIEDKVAPTIAKVTQKPAADGKVTVTVEFNETLQALGTVNVNNVTVVAALNADNKSFSLELDADKAYAIEVIGAQDIAGNLANPLTTSVSTVKDTVAPTLAVSAKDAVITLEFSEAVTEDFAVTVNGATLTAVPVKVEGKNIYTLDASELLATTNFLNNAKVKVTGIKDLAGISGKDVEATVNLKADTTAPKLVSKELKDNKLVLKFDEVVDAAALASFDATDLKLEYTNAEGVIIPLVAGDYTVAAEFGLDINGNEAIDAKTDEENYVVISLTDVNNKFTKNAKLLDGKYTFTIAKGDLQDAAGNEVVASTFTLVPTFSDAVVTGSVTYGVDQTGLANNQFKVVYNEEMSDSVLNAGNYTLAGAKLPEGTTLVFYGNKQTVLVTLPAGSIVSNGARILATSNVTSKTGNTISEDQAVVTVDLKESVAPIAKTVTIDSQLKATVDFSEDIKLAGVDVAVSGVTVKVNGIAVEPTLAVVNGDLTITFAEATLKATDKVTVTFESANLVDANGNKIADVVFN